MTSSVGQALADRMHWDADDVVDVVGIPEHTSAALAERMKFSPDQPRDDHGRFGEGGGESAATPQEAVGAAQAAVSLSDAEKSAVGGYAGTDDSFELNTYLRTGTLRGEGGGLSARVPAANRPEMADILNEDVAGLDGAVGKGTLPDTTLYRGLAAWDGFHDLMKPGAVVTDKAFTSTTLSESHATLMSKLLAPPGKDFVMEIHAPAGTKGLYLSPHLPGNKAKEQEVLLPRGSSFRVTSFDAQSGRIKAEVVR